MVDTNILFSAILGSKYLNKLIEKIIENYTFIICSYVIDELYDAVQRKYPEKTKEIDKFLRDFDFKLVFSAHFIRNEDRLFEIRDEEDYIILHTAIIENVDIFITNDKDFFDVDIKRPKIMNPEEFDKEY